MTVNDSNSQNSTLDPPASTDAEPSEPIIFFDGVCGLCNHFVNFVMARDHAGIFRFAPLQGTTAARLLNLPAEQALDSVVLWDRGDEYDRSAAVVRILSKLGGIWKLLAGLFWIIPLPLRNIAYSCVAKIRYRLFGKKETCRLPTAQERERFLD